MIFLTSDEGGIVEEEVESAASGNCCLGEDVILKLADISVQVMVVNFLSWWSP